MLVPKTTRARVDCPAYRLLNANRNDLGTGNLASAEGASL